MNLGYQFNIPKVHIPFWMEVFNPLAVCPYMYNKLINDRSQNLQLTFNI